MGVSICLKKVNLKFLKMGHARSRKGYFSKRSPLQALSSDLAEVELRRCEGADLQIGQERPHAFPDRRHSQDSHGVAQVKFVTGTKVLRILKAKGLASEIPEDLYHMIKKAVSIRKHLERNRKDRDAKFRFDLDRVSYSSFGALL